MANVLNKLTKQYLQSVNTPDYPTSEWLMSDITAATIIEDVNAVTPTFPAAT